MKPIDIHYLIEGQYMINYISDKFGKCLIIYEILSTIKTNDIDMALLRPILDYTIMKDRLIVDLTKPSPKCITLITSTQINNSNSILYRFSDEDVCNHIISELI